MRKGGGDLETSAWVPSKLPPVRLWERPGSGPSSVGIKGLEALMVTNPNSLWASYLNIVEEE